MVFTSAKFINTIPLSEKGGLFWPLLWLVCLFSCLLLFLLDCLLSQSTSSCTSLFLFSPHPAGREAGREWLHRPELPTGINIWLWVLFCPFLTVFSQRHHWLDWWAQLHLSWNPPTNDILSFTPVLLERAVLQRFVWR